MWSVWGICFDWRIIALNMCDGNWGKLTEQHEHTAARLQHHFFWRLTVEQANATNLEHYGVSKMLYLTPPNVHLLHSDEDDDIVMYAQKNPNRRTLQDLQIPDVPPPKKHRSGTAERRAVVESFSPPFSNSGVRDKTVCLLAWKLMLCTFYLCMCREHLLVSSHKNIGGWIHSSFVLFT